MGPDSRNTSSTTLQFNGQLNGQLNGFKESHVTESSHRPNAPNTLHVLFRVNRPISSGVPITLMGLTGSRTADNLHLRIGGASRLRLGFDMEPGYGKWSQLNGQLVVEALSGFFAGEPVDITFQLTNPGAASSPKALTVKIGDDLISGQLAGAHGGVLAARPVHEERQGEPPSAEATEATEATDRAALHHVLHLVFQVVSIVEAETRGQSS